jgi:4-amino-4-deoxy-L-arabinose transferase-like glycosyltransferase
VVLAGALVASLAAVLLGSVAIPAPHDGGDNATYLSLAHSLVSGRGYTELWDPQVSPHTKYPPVFPLALAALLTLGVTTWWGFKIFMALAVGGAAVFAFAWAARRSGPVAGAAVAVLVLLSGGWLQASRWVLSEPLFLLLTFSALWAAERGRASGGGVALEAPRGGAGARREDPSRWGLLAGALAILAFFTRSAGLPLVCGCGRVVRAPTNPSSGWSIRTSRLSGT